MSQALYRKYRSRSFEELIGQPHVTATLQNAIKQGKFSHAYLFSGPRGVGKTSVARILARQINQLDYASDEPHIDVIEIDAASNTSVEDIRDLREKVSVAPSLARYKVYIIDEVHMLSKSAFNALLKTLEEPPAHVVFILATTDPQKLPETIISRTQHFAFQPIASDLVAEELLAIAKAEKIKLDKEAASLIAELGEGSFRDSLSLLDQLAASGQTIDRQLVESLAGLPPAQLITDLSTAVDTHEPRQVVRFLADARASGFQASAITRQLSRLWREQALKTASLNKLALVKQLLAVANSYKPEELLEIILLEASLAGSNEPASESTLRPSQPADTPSSTPKSASQKPKPPETSKATTSSDASAEPPKHKSRPQTTSASELWASVLEQIRSQHLSTLYAMARMASPSLDDDKLTLEFPYPFHMKRLKESKNQQIIIKVASELAGRPLTISCELNQALASDEPTLAAISEPTVDPPMVSPLEPSAEASDIKNISNIFGGAELLQSD